MKKGLKHPLMSTLIEKGIEGVAEKLGVYKKYQKIPQTGNQCIICAEIFDSCSTT